MSKSITCLVNPSAGGNISISPNPGSNIITLSDDYTWYISYNSTRVLISGIGESGNPTYTITKTVNSGYTFDGWDISPNPGSTTPISSNNTYVTANFSYNYNYWTVVYNKNDGSGATDSRRVLSGYSHTVEGCDWRRTGYTFNTWSTTQSGSGTSYTPGSTIPAKAIGTVFNLYARWTRNTYNVTLDNNGGSGPEYTIQKQYEETYTLPSSGYSKNTSKVYEDHILTFDGDGGTFSYGGHDQLTTADVGIQPYYNVTWTFSGWDTDSESTSHSYGKGSQVTIDSDVTFYSIYLSNMGQINGVSLSTFPTNLYKLGYRARGVSSGETGWYYGGEKVTANTKFSSDATLTPVWVAEEYQIKYIPGDGSSFDLPQSQWQFTKTYGTPVTITNIQPTRVGYTFLGWGNPSVVDSQGNIIIYQPGSQLDDKLYTVIGDIKEFNAIWEAIPNTLNLKYYDSTGLVERVESYSKNVSQYTVQNPSWTDRMFVGWTNIIPQDWSTNHGLYDDIDDIQSVYVQKLQYNTSSIIEWGTNETYWGLWVRTGKKIKTRSGWKDVGVCYIKVSDNEWKKVKEMYIAIDKDSEGTIWKKEVD